MANWLVYTQPDDTDVSASNSFNLQGLTVGTIFDISDIFSIGYGYGFNFKSGHDDPGHMFVVGVGSRFIHFFKKDN